MLECSFRLSPKGAEDSFRRPLDCLLDIVVDQNQVRGLVLESGLGLTFGSRGLTISLRGTTFGSTGLTFGSRGLTYVSNSISFAWISSWMSSAQLARILAWMSSAPVPGAVDVRIDSCFHFFPSFLFSIFFSPSLLHRCFDDV